MKKFPEKIDFYFFRCYDMGRKGDLGMKKILASFMMIGLVFCLGACNLPWQKKEDEKEEKKQVVEASKVRGTMEGMTLKVGVSNEMAPFSYYDSNEKKIVGFDIDILEKISEYLGFDYDLYPMAMAEIEKKIKNGELDLAVAGISITDERQKQFAFTDSYYETYLQIVVNKSTLIAERKEIQGKVIGVETGTSNADYAEEYMSDQNTIKYYTSMKKLFKDLEAGKIDATIYDAPGVEKYLEDHKDQTNLIALEEKLNSEESNYGIMFAKGYKYLDQFNVALQVLNTDGNYQKIKETWLKSEE